MSFDELLCINKEESKIRNNYGLRLAFHFSPVDMCNLINTITLKMVKVSKLVK